MGTGIADPNSSADGGHKAYKPLKAYNAPQLRILTPEQAAAELRAKAPPGDAVAQQLLRIATELSRETAVAVPKNVPSGVIESITRELE